MKNRRNLLLLCCLLSSAVACRSSEIDPAPHGKLSIAERPPLELSLRLESAAAIRRAVQFLLDRQANDGSWHDSLTVTSLTLAALAQTSEAERKERVRRAISGALDYLGKPVEETDRPNQNVGRARGGEEDENGRITKGGLSRQAELVMHIMTAMGLTDPPSLPLLATRTATATETPAAVEVGVTVAVRIREAYESARPRRRQTVQNVLAWASAYFTEARPASMDRESCRSFIYMLGKALQAIRGSAKVDPGSMHGYRDTVTTLLQLQRTEGQWRGEEEATDIEETASTAFALLMFGRLRK